METWAQKQRSLFLKDSERTKGDVKNMQLARLQQAVEEKKKNEDSLGNILSAVVGGGAGFLAGGPLGAVTGAASGFSSKNPVEAGIRGYSSGAGLSAIADKSTDIGKQLTALTSPDNLVETGTYLSGLASGKEAEALGTVGKYRAEKKEKAEKAKQEKEKLDWEKKKFYLEESGKTEGQKMSSNKKNENNFSKNEGNADLLIMQAEEKLSDNPEKLKSFYKGAKKELAVDYKNGLYSKSYYNKKIMELNKKIEGTY